MNAPCARKSISTRLATVYLLSTALGFCGTGPSTAFTYQGRLNNGGNAVNGLYDFQFQAFDALSAGFAVGPVFATNGIAVSNGLFTVTLDLGATVFTGPSRWLQIGVRTNNGATFTTLAPLQALNPTPYAIYADNAAASGVVGTLANSQLLNNSVTVTAGPGLSGGGVMALGGATTLTNTGVISVTGDANFSIYTVGGAVSMEINATTLNDFNTIVKRDAAGSFAAGTITLGGTLNLPFPAATIYSGGISLMRVDGGGNFFGGPGAGNLALSGFYNTGLGEAAIANDTSGSYDTATGVFALYANTTGNNNTASGYNALSGNTTGQNNTASGAFALYANTNGNNNTASGAYALEENTSGFDNTASGVNALSANTTGIYDTASGVSALQDNTTGVNNTATGVNALEFNTNGNNNTASGVNALQGNTAGNFNTASGVSALQDNNTGSANTASGFQALEFNSGGSFNTAGGAYALNANTLGSYNTASGYDALDNNTTGSFNTACGVNALANNTNGIYNTASGVNALEYNTSGKFNTASGASCLEFNTTGSNNTASGVNALLDNTTGSNNTANGFQALYSNSNGGNNTACGYQALFANSEGDDNTATGFGSLQSNSTGYYNTAIGYGALQGLTSGSGNIALGDQAGVNLTTNNYNIDIGHTGVATDSSIIRIGQPGGHIATFIGGIYGANSANGAEVYINYSGQLGTLNSSVRFKQNIRSMEDASDVLLSLHPVTFQYKPAFDPQGLPQFGLIAEEVNELDPRLVARDEKGQILTVRYQAINAMLLNEFLKEHKKVEQQNARIEKLENQETEAEQIKRQNETLQKRLDLLEKAVQSLGANPIN